MNSALKIAITISERIEKAFQANISGENRDAILISEKIDFNLKLIWRDREGYFILIMGIIIQENISIICTYYIFGIIYL